MDFNFIGASMSSGVGEKITRAIEHATAERLPQPTLIDVFNALKPDDGVCIRGRPVAVFSI